MKTTLGFYFRSTTVIHSTIFVSFYLRLYFVYFHIFFGFFIWNEINVKNRMSTTVLFDGAKHGPNMHGYSFNHSNMKVDARLNQVIATINDVLNGPSVDYKHIVANKCIMMIHEKHGS